jgi:hypothetical protein
MDWLTVVKPLIAVPELGVERPTSLAYMTMEVPALIKPEILVLFTVAFANGGVPDMPAVVRFQPLPAAVLVLHTPSPWHRPRIPSAAYCGLRLSGEENVTPAAIPVPTVRSTSTGNADAACIHRIDAALAPARAMIRR